MKLDKSEALGQLAVSSTPFITLFRHGTLQVELYRPHKTDLQQAHTRDEAYVIIGGKGEFINGEGRCTFGPGNFLFVPARTGHRFENFSDDFSTWVLFYGPEGGEST